MAIEHDVITDPKIHEPKGAATALAGQLYVASGAGSGNWTSLQLDNITRPAALATLTSNATNTVIATVDIPVLIAGTFVDVNSEVYTVSAGGRITNAGSLSTLANISVKLDMEPVAGTKTLDVLLFKNGVLVVTPTLPKAVTAASPIEFTLIWQDNLVSTDFLELFVVNSTDAVDVNVNNCIFTIS